MKTLADFGYGFNKEGKLRKLDKITGELTDEPFEFEVSSDHSVNQKHYEELGDLITEHVYDLLVEDCGLQRIQIPDDVPKEKATFIFATKPDFSNSNKIMVFIHGSGVVRAGQWARRLIINESLDTGTQIPYIKRGQQLGYDILVLNPNDNLTKDGTRRVITGSSNPMVHGTTVWNKFLSNVKPKSVAIVAHSFGGVVVSEMVKQFPKFFDKNVFAIGLTDSVHSSMSGTVCKYTRNYVSSGLPAGTPISSSENSFWHKTNNVPTHSAGHKQHESTSWACMDHLINFFEEKYAISSRSY